MRGTSIHAVFRCWFGLTDAEAAILAALFEKAGEWQSREGLAVQSQAATGAIKRHVSSIRSALEAEAIDSAPGLGYALTDSGLGECRAALTATAGELLAA